MKSVFFAVLLACLPSSIRIPILRLLGSKIGRGCHIGIFTIVDAQQIVLGNHVRIASFNLIHRLVRIEMASGSRMNSLNWITGARKGIFFVGRNSAITRLHFFEASGDIVINENTIIAGRGSHFFTHGISSTDLDVTRSINIGAWCYIGSSSRFIPGSGVSNHSFVGMGSVVTKLFDNEYVLIAGNPAVIKKSLKQNDTYFTRIFLPHDHHPKNYNGDYVDY